MKSKPRIPTVDQFLTYVPHRGDFSWTETSDGLVHITVPKFTSKLGISFCKLLRRENTFTARLDQYGSFIWKLCDGKTSVQTILERVQQQFPNEKNIDQRLFLFLQQMHSLQYISY
ncbi:MAG: PqqD family protein [Candidatus Thermoplasmatota archaeon]